MEYLGFKLTPHGVLPGTDKTEIIRNAAPPDTVHKVQQFLGLCNFFRSHIKDFAIRSHPLTILTKNDCEWKGGPLPPGAMESFLELKTALSSSPLVAFPRSDRQYALITDAACGDDTNPGGMGAILTQIDTNGCFYVISYASRKLLKHEKNYTPFLLEMHAAVWGMDYFSHHLKGRRFLLFTDHKPLEKLGKVHTKTLHRIQEAMMDFDFEIHYKKGTEMPADYLSRNISSINDMIPDGAIATAQQGDPQLKAILAYLKHGTIPPDLHLKQTITRYAHKCFIENDILWIRLFQPETGSRALICVPASLRDQLITQFHSSWYGGHEGVHKTIQRLQLYYFWPSMQTDVNNVIKACETCQKRRTIPKTPPTNLQPLPTLTAPNQRIHADLFGPLKSSSSGKKFILVMTDAFTKYVEVIAIPNKEAETVAEAIFYNWICRYGIPAQLTTDQGKEFVASVCQNLWKQLDLLHITTSARHPQANSQAEVINKTIARYLASFVNETTLDWEQYLAPLMFSYNTAFHRSIKTSPFFLTYGVHPSLPKQLTSPAYGSDLPTDLMSRLQIARNIARQHMMKASEEYEKQFNLHARHKQFAIGQPVLIDEHSFLGKNAKLAPKYSGPHLVKRLIGNTNLELLLDNGKSTVIHVNRVKPYKCLEQTSQLQPPPPGSLFQNKGGVKDETKIENEDTHVDQDQQEAGGQLRRQTRSVTKAKGMVYNEEQKQYLISIIGDTEQATASKKKKTKASQVKYIPYIEYEDHWEIIRDKEDQSDSEPETESMGDDEVFYPDTPFPTPLRDKRKVAFDKTPHIHQEIPPQFKTNKRILYDPLESTEKQQPNLFKATIDGTARILFGGREDSTSDHETEERPYGGKEGSEIQGRLDPASIFEYGGKGELKPILRKRSGDGESSPADTQRVWPGGWRSGRDSLGRPTSNRQRTIAMGKKTGSCTDTDLGGQRSPSGGHSSTHEDATKGGAIPRRDKSSDSRAGENHPVLQGDDSGKTKIEGEGKTTVTVSETDTGVQTRYSRMATRARPDHLDNPWQLSEWFAKGEGFNDPAVLRVLASRYLTDVSEINLRVPTQPPSPEIFQELERRRQFLIKELRRTGTRVKGFNV